VAAGITDYILKPIDENLLLDKVELCIKKGPGNKHTLNSPISETQAPASLFFDCRMQFISETYFVARIPFLIPCDTEVQIRTPLFDEIGISPPIIKLVSCKAIPMSLESRTYPYEAHFSLVGVLESDLRKIRIWINRESLQRRK